MSSLNIDEAFTSKIQALRKQHYDLEYVHTREPPPLSLLTIIERERERERERRERGERERRERKRERGGALLCAHISNHNVASVAPEFCRSGRREGV